MSCSISNERGRCSNHGYYCDLPGKELDCICDDGWTSLGCFALVGGTDCDGQDYHSLILWYIAILTTALCMIPTLTLLFHRTLRYTWNTKIIWGFEYNAKSLFPWFNQLQLFDLFLFSLLKIIYKNQQLIGRDIAITIVYLFSPLLTIISLVTYFFIVTKFLRHYTTSLNPEIRDKVLKRFNVLNKLALLIPVLSLIPSLIPIVGISMPEYRDVYAKISLIGMGLMVTMLGSLCVNALDFLLRELSSHINSFDQSDKDIIIVYKRLRLAYYGFFMNTIGIASTYWLFGIWDFLFTKTTYLFVYIICCVAIASLILIKTLSTISRPSVVKPTDEVILLHTANSLSAISSSRVHVVSVIH
mmetsp:Transcript_8055/g.8080  ORF Transcript_8055/g.8080 Transcript_8055/m.8080 type:complete len:358 (+) Transcript_8055:617-1690(+)